MQSPERAPGRRRRGRGRTSLVPALGLALLVALVLAPTAGAWKGRDHLWAADTAVGPIRAGGSTVTIDGRAYRVRPEVAAAIRRYPADYRGGVLGPDAFPDIIAGQGSVHPDTRTDNGTRAVPRGGPGSSYTWEWLAHVYRSGWAAYRANPRSEAGQRALAFTYGFLTHAAEDVWGHTLANQYARGVFPALPDFVTQSGVIARHMVVEGYLAQHTPPVSRAVDAPPRFLYETFIADPVATRLGRGRFVETVMGLRSALGRRRDALTRRIGRSPLGCVRHPLLCLQRAYIRRWIDDIDDGLRAWPVLSARLARSLLADQADTDAVRKDVNWYVNRHLLSMIGLPDAVGSVRGVLQTLTEPFLKPFKEIRKSLIDYIMAEATGMSWTQWKGVQSAALINSPRIGLGPKPGLPSTSAQLDALMGLSRNGLITREPFRLDRFAAMGNTVTMAQLALLDADGLNQLLTDHGVAPAFSDTATLPANVMLDVTDSPVSGWVKSIDADHQWSRFSSRDGRSYGTGEFFLWQDCDARRNVFRVVFRDWEHGDLAFPDDAVRCDLLPPEDEGEGDDGRPPSDLPTLGVSFPPVAEPNGPYSGVVGVPVAFDGTGSSALSSKYWNVWASVPWATANERASRATEPGCGPGHLATITSRAEQDALDAGIGPDLQLRWLGGYQDVSLGEPSGGWRWVTGEPWEHTNWQPGEPNNDGGVEHVLGVGGGAQGQWNDFDENRLLGYIIEHDDCVVDLTWDFGDGTVQRGGGITSSHAYAAPGTYDVCLKVTDPNAWFDRKCTTAVITAP